MAPTPSAEIGVTGLGVMGRNLARNFARHGFATALQAQLGESDAY